MATRKEHREFTPLNLEKSNVRNTHQFNDVELILLSNFTIPQEFYILFMINLHQKYIPGGRKHFRIPYTDIMDKTGMDRKVIKRHLKTLRDKQILVMIEEMTWTWNLPQIAKLLGPKAQPVQEQDHKPRVRSEKVIFISTPIEDPLLSGLPENWDKI